MFPYLFSVVRFETDWFLFKSKAQHVYFHFNTRWSPERAMAAIVLLCLMTVFFSSSIGEHVCHTLIVLCNFTTVEKVKSTLFLNNLYTGYDWPTDTWMVGFNYQLTPCSHVRTLVLAAVYTNSSWLESLFNPSCGTSKRLPIIFN